MSTDPSSKHPVVFVHGMWLHAQSWQPWIEFFRQNGYAASAVSWPGDAPTTEATRGNPSALAGFGVQEAEHGLVAAVHAVEVADRQGAGRSHARVPKSAEDLHRLVSF